MVKLRKHDGKIVSSRRIFNCKSGELPAVCEDAHNGNDDVTVNIVMTRPISAPDKEIALIAETNEVLVLENLDCFDHSSKLIVKEELERKYFIPKITKIKKARVHLGNRYFSVQTDRGDSEFIIKNPYVSIRPYQKDGVLIRDVIGNMFVITSIEALDKKSKNELSRVI